MQTDVHELHVSTWLSRYKLEKKHCKAIVMNIFADLIIDAKAS